MLFKCYDCNLSEEQYEGVFGIIEIQRTAAKMSQEKLKIKKA